MSFVLLIAQRPDINKNDKIFYFEKGKKMVILENNKNEKILFQNFNGKCFIFDRLYRDRNHFSKTLPDFRHRSDQLYHLWQSPLGDPLIILQSIYI